MSGIFGSIYIKTNITSHTHHHLHPFTKSLHHLYHQAVLHPSLLHFAISIPPLYLFIHQICIHSLNLYHLSLLYHLRSVYTSRCLMTFPLYRRFFLHRVYIGLKLVFAVAIFFTYGIQFYVPAHLILPVIQSRCSEEWLERNYLQLDYAVRAGFVLCTCKL